MIFSFLKNLSTSPSSLLFFYFSVLTDSFFTVSSLVFHMLKTRNRLSPKLFQKKDVCVHKRTHTHTYKNMCNRSLLTWFSFVHALSFFFVFLSISHVLSFHMLRLHFNCKVFVYRIRYEMEKRKIENELKRLYLVVCLFVWKCCLKTYVYYMQQQ